MGCYKLRDMLKRKGSSVRVASAALQIDYTKFYMSTMAGDTPCTFTKEERKKIMDTYFCELSEEEVFEFHDNTEHKVIGTLPKNQGYERRNH